MTGAVNRYNGWTMLKLFQLIYVQLGVNVPLSSRPYTSCEIVEAEMTVVMGQNLRRHISGETTHRSNYTNHRIHNIYGCKHQFLCYILSMSSCWKPWCWSRSCWCSPVQNTVSPYLFRHDYVRTACYNIQYDDIENVANVNTMYIWITFIYYILYD